MSRPSLPTTEILTDLEKLSFEVFEGEDFVEQDVYLDGRHFRNCTFRHCKIFVKLGNFRIDGQHLTIEYCQFVFDGPAGTVKSIIDLVFGQRRGA